MQLPKLFSYDSKHNNKQIIMILITTCKGIVCNFIFHDVPPLIAMNSMNLYNHFRGKNSGKLDAKKLCIQ